VKAPGLFHLPGQIGEFPGDQQRSKLAITISGRGSGKTWFVMGSPSCRLAPSLRRVNLPKTDFDRLRQEHTNTIRVVIFLPNAEGSMCDSVTAIYDVPVVPRAHNVDSTLKNKYVSVEKNQGNELGVVDSIVSRECRKNIVRNLD
jgi:hypothetical protein